MDLKLEVIVVPVSDVDRAKKFFQEALGFRLDVDLDAEAYEKLLGFRPPGGSNFRDVQLTPPGSGCSIHIGTRNTRAKPGSLEGLYLVTSDIETTRAELVRRGVDVSEPFHLGPDGQTLRVHPEHQDYNSYMTFNDPDGNGWIVQEIKKRLPGREIMSDEINPERRRFLATAAMTIAGAQFGKIDFAKSQSNPIKQSTSKSFGAMKQIAAGVLNVGFAEAGPADGRTVILLHGWPYDIYSYVDVAPLLASKGYRVIVPYLRGYGSTRFLSNETVRNGQQSAIAVDMIALMDALKIENAIIGGFDWGARTANIMAALWPQRCKALVSVSGYLIGSQEANKMPLPPNAEPQWWYQFYFATERGRAGYEKYCRDFNKLIWKLASPKWNFDDATFDRSAASFDNPDHVSIVIHNYRWRLGVAEGEAKYDDLEKRLAGSPAINVPTITLEGDANGAPHPDPSVYARKFSRKYSHRTIKGGIGHNLPQEAPQAFAQAVIDVDSY